MGTRGRPPKKTVADRIKEVIEVGKSLGVDEIEIDGIRVKFRQPEAEIPAPEGEEKPVDWREEEMRMLLHSTNLTDEQIDNLLK